MIRQRRTNLYTEHVRTATQPRRCDSYGVRMGSRPDQVLRRVCSSSPPGIRQSPTLSYTLNSSIEPARICKLTEQRKQTPGGPLGALCTQISSNFDALGDFHAGIYPTQDYSTEGWLVHGRMSRGSISCCTCTLTCSWVRPGACLMWGQVVLTNPPLCSLEFMKFDSIFLAIFFILAQIHKVYSETHNCWHMLVSRCGLKWSVPLVWSSRPEGRPLPPGSAGPSGSDLGLGNDPLPLN